MRYRIYFIAIVLILTCFLSLNCGKKTLAQKNITVSILPQKYFVERIAGDKYAINLLIPPGHSPATYELTAMQIKALQNSIIYFTIGHISFEKTYIEKIKSVNKKMKIIDTSKGVALIKGNHDYHNNSKTKNNTINGIDPHIWLSPTAVKIIALNIYKSISEIDPDNKLFYKNNYLNFIKDIEDLDKKIRESLKDIKNREFMIYHPSFEYFARDYELKQIAIETDGKSPSLASIKNFLDIAREKNIKVIFVQSQSPTHEAEAIARDIDAKVMLIDPLALDWLTNIESITETFRRSMK